MKQTVSSLKKKADKVFSEYIRQRDRGRCVTCVTRKPWKEMQAGHYVSRSHNATRYDEKNVNCQCVGCNVFKSGNMPSYTLFLQKKYGQNIIQELVKKSRKIKQFTTKELEGLIEEYKQKVSTLD